jgi:hypothetical protein
MVNIARTALSEDGRPDLAIFVQSDADCPIFDWAGMRRPPSLEDVRVVHAAMLRAYYACAPDMIGERVGQFTADADRWYRSILRKLIA